LQQANIVPLLSALVTASLGVGDTRSALAAME
jgi:hypothetical protein